MPELPEVEVLRRSLEPLVVGSRIARVEVRCAALREPVDRPSLERAAHGKRIQGVRRRAKYLLIDLQHRSTLAVHLGMSGRLELVPSSAPHELHEHVSFELSGRRDRLRLRDPRRFGLVLVLPTDELERDRHFASLGLEPLDEGFSGRSLRLRAGGRRGPVKSFLMDSRAVVGIGNIYANEALHLAGIHPARSVARISPVRWQGLAEAIVRTLCRAIAQGGTTLNDFADSQGRRGYFQVSLAVYGRQGQPCQRCSGSIRRVVQAGRSTFYCPGCQR